jgi:pimeloyl-ACP methyl ester carboxylesterase
VSLAEDLHRAIFGRSSKLAGPLTKTVHNGIAGGIYGGLRGLFHGLGYLAGAGLSRFQTDGVDHFKDSSGGGFVLGVLGGVHGDHLHRDKSALAVEMTLREHRGDVALDPPGLATSFPDATSRVAVFVHGLCATEETWWWFGGRSTCYGSLLQRDLGYTPLFVRYNSGLHISENGAGLSRLMASVFDSWPVALHEVVLVGHSMGGLVVRSACHYGARSGEAWIDAVGDVFCLGSPHLGTPLEKAANFAGWTLGRVSETRPLARIVNGRSDGIKDLRFGYIVDQDWQDHDADVLLHNNRHHVPFLETSNYCNVGATLTRAPRHPVGHILGDLLVRFPSASAQATRDQRMQSSVDHGHHVGGLTHFHMLNNPTVYGLMRTRLNRAGSVGLLSGEGSPAP